MRLEPFSNSYCEAREKFLNAVHSASGRVWSHIYPNIQGPVGENLFTDIACFGSARAKNILLCVSGTHGAEGFPGSALQTHWISQNQDSLAAQDGDYALWFIHAVNPFGFAWQMRGNEDHIDLNRNWVDFSAAPPENTQYRDLVPILRGFSGEKHAEHETVAALERLKAENGYDWLEDALTRGQYDYPDLMYYGGQSPARSRQIIEHLVNNHLRDAKRVAYVDLHSGTLGVGDLIFLCFSPPRSAAFARAASWWGEKNLDPETVEKKWGGARPGRTGLMYWGLEELFGSHVAFSGAVVEFGTLAPEDHSLDLLAALSEGWLRRGENFKSDAAQRHVDRMRVCFDRPGDEIWEAAVLNKGSWVLDRAVYGLHNWMS